VWLIISLILVALLALFSSLFALAVTRVPVVRTPADFLSEIAKACDASEDTLIVDAGCGDARTLVTLCESSGARGRGYELNGPVRLAGALRVLLSAGRRRIKLYWRDFYRCDLEDVDVVYCFLMPGVMTRVGVKCAEEMRPGARLISYLWKVPGWQPAQELFLGARLDPLYVYEIPPVLEKDQETADPTGSKT
jgi:hypothetical protein